MGETGGAVEAVASATPDVAALGLSGTALADVAVVVPGGGGTARTTKGPELTVSTGAPRRAVTGVAGDTVDAGGTVGAGVAGALVDVDAAVGAGEARGTLTAEPVDAVDAATTVETGQWLAVIDVAPAAWALEALAADAVVAAGLAVDAGGAVLARVGGTGGRGDVAGGALPARRAVTGEAVAAVLTGAAVSAGAWLAVPSAQSARLALPTVTADTAEVRDTIHAGPVVLAWLVHALVHICETIMIRIRNCSASKVSRVVILFEIFFMRVHW